MHKNKFILTLLLVISLLMVGCGSGYPSSARNVINAFFRAYSDGNIEEALKYCDKDGEAYSKLSQITEDQLIHDFAISMSDDEEIQDFFENNKNIRKLFHEYYTAMFKNYQIVDYEEEKESATYEVSISRLDENTFVVPHSAVLSIFNDYYERNSKQIDKIIEEDGEDAAIQKYIKDKGKDIVNAYIKDLKEYATYSNKTYYVELEKINKKWKIIRWSD